MRLIALRVIRLMNQLGLQTIYPKKRTTVANREHQVYPYLLRELALAYSNQVGVYRHHLFTSKEGTFLRLLPSWIGILAKSCHGGLAIQWRSVFVEKLYLKRC